MTSLNLNRRPLLERLALCTGLIVVLSNCSGSGLEATKQSSQQQSSKQQSDIQGVPVSSSFRVDIQGETEADEFSNLPAVLEILPPEVGDRNPLLISLYMTAQSDAELVNGGVFWQSYTAGHPQQDEHLSQVSVSGGQVQLQVNPSDDALRSDVMWLTQVDSALPGTSLDGGSTRSSATPEEGTMTFTVENGQVSGEMQLTGVTDLGSPSTYRATFSGQQQ